MPAQATLLRCLCGNVKEAASLLESTTLPIETEICYCNPCRQGSGALCPAFARLKGRPSSLTTCTRYIRPGGKIDRYFCSTCGCRTFDHVVKPDNWFACSGIVEPSDSTRNVIKVTSHKYVADTVDGCLSLFMPELGGRDIPYYAEADVEDEPKMTASEIANLKEQSLSKMREEILLASCHCESIQFNILPPQNAGDNVSDPKIARWLRNGKYLALNCACSYCRRAVGFSFASNTYIMPENIVSVNTSTRSLFNYTSRDEQISDFTSSTKSLQEVFPRLRFDFSSPGIRRSFCGVCGASIFFERATRPQCVNVAIGILRAKSGSLATNWIDFDWEMCWREQAVDNEIVQALDALRAQ